MKVRIPQSPSRLDRPGNVGEALVSRELKRGRADEWAAAGFDGAGGKSTPFWVEKGKHLHKLPASSGTLLDHILERGVADVTHDRADSYRVA